MGLRRVSVTVTRLRPAAALGADLRMLEERSANLKMASGSLREKSKVLLEPRHYFRQKLRELQEKQRERYRAISDEAAPPEMREAVRVEFAEGEQKISEILLELQRHDEVLY